MGAHDRRRRKFKLLVTVVAAAATILIAEGPFPDHGVVRRRLWLRITPGRSRGPNSVQLKCWCDF